MKTMLSPGRRAFLKKTSLAPLLVAGAGVATGESMVSMEDQINVIGPKEGYTPQIGTLVSMMNWMRSVILWPVRDLSIEELDYLHDKNSNSIGSMLLHLAATERLYQRMTFEGKKGWDGKDKERFEIAMNLGDEGRKTIKGNNLNFYLDTLSEVRTASLQELKKRDDKWLMQVDEGWGWGPTNNYCKWFHVVEHESNHNGQIKYIRSRLPGGRFAQD